MKNLIISNQKVFVLPKELASQHDRDVSGEYSFNPHVQMTMNHAQQIIYYCNENHTLIGYSLVDQKVVLEIPLISSDDENPLLNTDDSIVSLQYLPEIEAVVVVASNDEVGSILQVTVASSTEGLANDFQDDNFASDNFGMTFDEAEAGNVEIIGQIPLGFTDAAWSPDQDMFVLTCNSGALLIMSKDFDMITDTTLTGDVAARKAVDASNPYNFLPGTDQYKNYQELQKENVESIAIETNGMVCWRGDGQFFVTSSLDSNNLRRIRVWNRQGQLQSVSEPSPSFSLKDKITCPSENLGADEVAVRVVTNQELGLSPLLAWRPSGNLITSVERKLVPAGQGVERHQQQVVFFERNGLRRGEFDIIPPKMPLEWAGNRVNNTVPSTAGISVTDLAWSSDSKILAVGGVCLHSGARVIQLWTTGNYHWYLKQSLTYPSPQQLAETLNTAPSTSSLGLIWQQERTQRLIVNLDNSVMYVYDIIADTVLAPTPLASCGVVDGHVLLLTHLQRSAIPPPLAARNILLPCPISEVVLATTVPCSDYHLTTPVNNTNPALRSSGDMRIDLVAPIAVTTPTNDILLLTDAIQPPSPVLPEAPLGSVFAPIDQPERAMGLTKSSASQARPCAYFRLPRDLVVTNCLSSIRHVQWLECGQWRDAHLNFTLQMQEYYKTNNNHSNLPAVYPHTPYNLLTFIETTPNNHDQLVCIWFQVSFTLSKKSFTFIPSIASFTIKRFPLDSVLSSTVADITNSVVGQTTAVNTTLDTFLPFHLKALHKCIARTYLVNPGSPMPIVPRSGSMSALEASEWHIAHTRAQSAKPWLAVLTVTGQVIRVDLPPVPPKKKEEDNSKKVSLSDLGPLVPSDSLWFLVADMAGKFSYVGKDTMSRLFIDNTLVAPQCMSFQQVSFNAIMQKSISQYTHVNTTGYGANVNYEQQNTAKAFQQIPEGLLPSFLLLTVAGQQHALFTLDLRCTLAENIEPSSAIRADPHMVRFVERGSHIVAPIADLLRPRVILQMPRGNLELITPRSLGLAAIHVALSSRQYLQAFLSMRANRIDLNLMFDHSPSQFEEDIDELVRQLRTAENISLFLSALTEVDCTVAQFPRYHQMFGNVDDIKLLMSAQDSCDTGVISFESGLTTQVDHIDHDTISSAGGFSLNDRHSMDLDMSSLLPDLSDTDSTGPVRPNPNGITDDMEELSKKLQNTHVSEKEDTRSKKKAKPTDESYSNRTRAHKKMAEENMVEMQDSSLATDMDAEMGLGAEAGASLAADGSGMSTFKQLSRVQHWGTSDIDIRHVYTNATEEEDSAVVKRANQPEEAKSLGYSKYQFDVKKPAKVSEDDEDDGTNAAGLAPPTSTTPAYTSKINHVCGLVLAALERADTDEHGRQYINAKLTAHLRRSPPAFDCAIKLIADIAAFEAKTNKGPTVQPSLPKPRSEVLGPRPTVTTISMNECGGRIDSKTDLPLVTAERALKYVLILADHGELWKASLSQYDLTLAASVAQHSGKDPKSYLPFLASLHKTALYGPELTLTQTLPLHVQTATAAVSALDGENYEDVFTHDELARANVVTEVGLALQRAAIDIHLDRVHHSLKHYASAIDLLQVSLEDKLTPLVSRVKANLLLQSIRKLVVDYTTKLELFELSVNLFCHNLPSPSLLAVPSPTPSPMSDAVTFSHRILSLYAQWLFDNKRFVDAAQVYGMVGDVANTINAHVESGKWNLAVTLLTFHPSAYPDTKNLYLRMVDVLVEKKQWVDAAHVRSTYLNDVAGAVKLLLTSQQWDSALQFTTTLADSRLFLDGTVIPFIVAAAEKNIQELEAKLKHYKYSVNRLRIVRRVKLIIFGAIAGLPEALALWNKGSNDQGGGINDIPSKPSLMMRIPGDDVLEFILTGVWRGIQTGLCADGTGAGSLANYSTATGMTLGSLAPSVAASMASLSSVVSGAKSMASMLSGMSMTSQSSILSVSSEAALTPAEKRLAKHMKRMQSKKMKKKIREGDPREEAELILEIASLTPGPVARQKMYHLLNTLQLIGQYELSNKLQTAYKKYLDEIEYEESVPMPTLQGISPWQSENVANYFNWPGTSHEDEAVIAEKVLKRDQEREKENEKKMRAQAKNYKHTKKTGVIKPEAPEEPEAGTFSFVDWRKYTDCSRFSPTPSLLTSSDMEIRHNTTEAMLAFIDAVTSTPTKFTTQLRNEGNAPKARNVV